MLRVMELGQFWYPQVEIIILLLASWTSIVQITWQNMKHVLWAFVQPLNGTSKY